MARLPGNSDMDKLKALSSRQYAEQAKWVLNAYWSEWGEAKSEVVWDVTHKMTELDEKNGGNGNDLEELIAHRFLEELEETLTVRELREVLRKIDIDTNKRLSLSEYLIYRFKIEWHDLVNSIQGDKAQIAEAQRLLDAAQAALLDSQQKAKLARDAEAEALEAEKEFKIAQEEVEATLAELKRQQDAYDNKLSTLEARGNDSSLGLVARNKARNELAQAKNEDPLPLARAKISSEAALRRAEKARAPFKAKREAAEAQRADAEASLAAANEAFKKAEDYFEEVKRTSESKGSMWWLGRELEEAKKYLPQSKGGRPK